MGLRTKDSLATPPSIAVNPVGGPFNPVVLSRIQSYESSQPGGVKPSYAPYAGVPAPRRLPLISEPARRIDGGGAAVGAAVADLEVEMGWVLGVGDADAADLLAFH